MDLPSVDGCRELLASCSPERIEGLLAALEADPRSSVRALAAARRRTLRRAADETERAHRMMAAQSTLHVRGFAVVAGVDEVGRGALAGPVTAAAVILDVAVVIPGLDDSKRLTPDRRRSVADAVRSAARDHCVAHASVAEIDALGIAHATRLAWTRALDGLSIAPDHVLVDGNDASLPRPATALVRGDATCSCIAAASVIAKVERDGIMEALARDHPGYALDANKGYGTAEHLEAVQRLGPSSVHRRSFTPCSQGPLF